MDKKIEGNNQDVQTIEYGVLSQTYFINTHCVTAAEQQITMIWLAAVHNRQMRQNKFSFLQTLYSLGERGIRTRLVFRVRLVENCRGSWYRNVGIIECNAFGVLWGGLWIHVFSIVVVGPVTLTGEKMATRVSIRNKIRRSTRNKTRY